MMDWKRGFIAGYLSAAVGIATSIIIGLLAS